jgi:hypothetical protein
VIFWADEGPTDLPQHGVRCTPKPLPWPPDPALASVPQWAWRLGHAALSGGLRDAVNAVAAEHGFPPLMREDCRTSS